jgi:ubiquinone/menaquinone biosynthesis C-methylase UbiE
MSVGRQIEPKPTSVESARPLSWGEREEQRRNRKSGNLHSTSYGFIARVRNRLSRFTRALGLTRNKIVIDGVIYRERSTTSLRRTLSLTGSGVKEYDVEFSNRSLAIQSQQYPWREKMRIRYTRNRVFADLGNDPRVQFVDQLKDLIKPGFRVLELGCGTGSSSRQLAELVGPSGGVVAIDRDGESIRYARQRHRRDHLGFELGWVDTLEGELDGAFDAVLGVDLFRDVGDEPAKSRAVSSIWRVLSSGGVIGVLSIDQTELGSITDRLGALGAEEISSYQSQGVHSWGSWVGKRPEKSEEKTK